MPNEVIGDMALDMLEALESVQEDCRMSEPFCPVCKLGNHERDGGFMHEGDCKWVELMKMAGRR